MIALWALWAANAAPEQEGPADEEASEEPEEAPDPTAPDRTTPPEVPPPVPLELPEPEVHELGPGVSAWHVRVPSVRKVVVDVVLRQGMVEQLQWPSQEGRATGWMADVAAGERDGSALSAIKDMHEIDLWSSIGLHDGRVRLMVPETDLALGLELQSQVLHQPTFPKKDLKRYLFDQELFYTVEGPSSQSRVASSALAFAWFPADYAYGARPDLDTLGAIKGPRLAEIYKTWTTSAPITVIVVGDVPFSQVEGPLKTMMKGLGADAPVAEALEVPAQPEGVRAIAVDMPGQDQVAVRLRMEGPPETHPDRAAMTSTNWVFGGHFLSRLNRVLREEKGFTYGSYASYRKGPTWGSVTVSVDVGADNLAETIELIREQVDALVADGATAGELDTAQRSLVQDWNLTMQTAERAAGLYVQALDERSSIDDIRARHLAFGQVTPEEVQRVAEAWMAADKPRLWVLVGDRRKMEPALEDAGLDLQWIEPRQAILGNF